MRPYLIVTSAFALAACGQEAAAPPAKVAAPARLPAGQYEVTATVESLASTDKTPVPTFAKAGDTATAQGCVGEDGVPKAELLAAPGDACAVKEPYIRGGRMNLTLDCTRPGQGKVMATVDGKYTAEGFTGTLIATTAFVGSGDYRLVEKLTARKVADQCTTVPAAGGKKAA